MSFQRLRMPRSLYDLMISHASAAVPMEAVGLLGGGGDGEVRRQIPLPNLAGAKSFLADPYAQFRAMRELSAEGMKPLAVYHSHPQGGVRLSDEDVLFARRLPYLQVVIALGRPHNPAVESAAYRVSGAVIEEVQVEVLEDA